MKTIKKTLPTGIKTEHNQEGHIHVTSKSLTVVTGNPMPLDVILGKNIWKK